MKNVISKAQETMEEREKLMNYKRGRKNKKDKTYRE